MSSREDFIHRRSKVPMKQSGEYSMDEFRKVVAPFAPLYTAQRAAATSAQKDSEEKTRKIVEERFKNVYESPSRGSRSQSKDGSAAGPEMKPREEEKCSEAVQNVRGRSRTNSHLVENGRAETMPMELKRPQSSSHVNRLDQRPPVPFQKPPFVGTGSTPKPQHKPSEERSRPAPQSRNAASQNVASCDSKVCHSCKNKEIALEQATHALRCKHEQEKVQLEKLKQELETKTQESTRLQQRSYDYRGTSPAKSIKEIDREYKIYAQRIGQNMMQAAAISLTMGSEWSTTKSEKPRKNGNGNDCDKGFLTRS